MLAVVGRPTAVNPDPRLRAHARGPPYTQGAEGGSASDSVIQVGQIPGTAEQRSPRIA